MRNILIDFVKWYWQNVQGKPYDISAEALVDTYPQINDYNHDERQDAPAANNDIKKWRCRAKNCIDPNFERIQTCHQCRFFY